MSTLRSSAGPDVVCMLTPISVAMMSASVVLPRPGGPASSTWSRVSPRLRGRLDEDLQLLLGHALADEVGEPARPQGELEVLLVGALVGVGDAARLSAIDSRVALR